MPEANEEITTCEDSFAQVVDDFAAMVDRISGKTDHIDLSSYKPMYRDFIAELRDKIDKGDIAQCAKLTREVDKLTVRMHIYLKTSDEELTQYQAELVEIVENLTEQAGVDNIDVNVIERDIDVNVIERYDLPCNASYSNVRGIGVDTSLSKFLDYDQMTAVIAHEIGHDQYEEPPIATAYSIAAADTAIFISILAVTAKIWPKTRKLLPTLAIGVAVFAANQLDLNPVNIAIERAESRHKENWSDDYAAELTSPEKLISYFERSRHICISQDKEPSWVDRLFASHYPEKERIERLREKYDIPTPNDELER